MKTSIDKLARRVQRVIERMGYERARVEMLQLSDRLLEDIGVSRALLEQGVGAWPWRERSTDVSAVDTKSPVNLNPAIAELRRYSDKELNELGVARGDIETVVAYGRDGIDPPYNAAA